jgi:hypothetical protein
MLLAATFPPGADRVNDQFRPHAPVINTARRVTAQE